jgi:hypothetical protein
VTVPTGYNTKRLTEEGLSVFSIKPDLYGWHHDGAVTLWQTIQAYDAERPCAICCAATSVGRRAFPRKP